MKLIPFYDLKRQYAQIKQEIVLSMESVFENTAFAGGKYVELFEQDLARYNHVSYVVGVNSGTSALHLAVLALGIGKGDEVILPANTFIATAWAISYVGAIPVFVDCDPLTWNIDYTKIESRITSKTKAIIGVHLYGQPCDIDPIKKITSKYQLFFIEDNAQGIGALYKGKKSGTFSDIACTSFYPGKNLGAYGEAGAVFTEIEEYARRIKRLRNQGSDRKYYHDEIGFNMRMDGLQAAVLSVKLKYLDKWNNRRREIALAYNTRINSPYVQKQFQPNYIDSIYHLYVIKVRNREKFINHMSSQNIELGIHYPLPCHLQKAYDFLGYKKGDMPNAEDLSESCVSLPMFPELEDSEVDFVIEAVNSYKG